MPGFITLPNGFKIPMIGYGTAKEESVIEKGLEMALEAGYRYIDTAHIYQSESVIGRVLKKWIPEKLKREDIFICSKFFPNFGTDNDVETVLKDSLKKLNVDYVDLYLVHRIIYPVENYLKVWRQMEDQVDAGRTKYIGLSNVNIPTTKYILDNARIKPVNIQNQVQLYGQQNEYQRFCKDKNLTLTSSSPLGCPGRTSGNKLDIIYNETVKKIADKYGKFPAQIALRFLIQKDIVPIPNSVKKEHIEINFKVFDFTISEEDMKTLEDLNRDEMLYFN